MLKTVENNRCNLNRIAGIPGAGDTTGHHFGTIRFAKQLPAESR
jgi:hypothetical protein